jgi:hypothetical protein
VNISSIYGSAPWTVFNKVLTLRTGSPGIRLIYGFCLHNKAGGRKKQGREGIRWPGIGLLGSPNMKGSMRCFKRKTKSNNWNSLHHKKVRKIIRIDELNKKVTGMPRCKDRMEEVL